MLREHKTLIWLMAIALVVVTASAVSKCRRAASPASPVGGGLAPSPALTEVSPWRLVR
jgi:hypothetical protein